MPPTERTGVKRPVYQGKITPNLSGTSVRSLLEEVVGRWEVCVGAGCHAFWQRRCAGASFDGDVVRPLPGSGRWRVRAVVLADGGSGAGGRRSGLMRGPVAMHARLLVGAARFFASSLRCVCTRGRWGGPLRAPPTRRRNSERWGWLQPSRPGMRAVGYKQSLSAGTSQWASLGPSSPAMVVFCVPIPRAPHPSDPSCGKGRPLTHPPWCGCEMVMLWMAFADSVLTGGACPFFFPPPRVSPFSLLRLPQEAYVPTHHVNSPEFKGQAGEKVSAWDPSTAATPSRRGVRPRTPADTAADTKDILDLK